MNAQRTALIEHFRGLRPTRADYPPWPSPEELADRVLAGGPAEARQLAELFDAREAVIRAAKDDPFACGFEWECWRRADNFLPVKPWSSDEFIEPAGDTRLLLVFGGNRASKTRWATKRCLQYLLRFPKTKLFMLAQKLETSYQNQQTYVYEQLPLDIRALNNKAGKHTQHKIAFRRGTGFADNKLVLPNGSELVFLVYTQDPSDYEGVQIGSPDQPGVVGWYADESLPLEWLKLLRTRSVTWDAVGLWTFTPLRGMTPAIKETLGQGRIIEAELEPALEDRETLPGWPRGYMPTIQQGATKDIVAVYFHTRENPVGGYERLVRTLEGKPQFALERALCGFARDTKGRIFTTFGPHNVVEPAAVPAAGARYMHIDPHTARNWFMLWVLVDDRGTIWAYDEWPPDEQYGEWAVPTERNPDESGGGGWDGDVGPAQEVIGWGIAQYKREILRREAGALIERRTVDRRAAPAPTIQTSGPSTSIWQELNDTQDTAEGEVPALDVDLAGGTAIEEDGLEMLKEALWYDRDRPFDPLRNSPRLFVSSYCKHLIWALSHYTGRDGNKGACKDPIDCLRDMLTSGLEPAGAGSYGSFGGWDGHDARPRPGQLLRHARPE